MRALTLCAPPLALRSPPRDRSLQEPAYLVSVGRPRGTLSEATAHGPPEGRYEFWSGHMLVAQLWSPLRRKRTFGAAAGSFRVRPQLQNFELRWAARFSR